MWIIKVEITGCRLIISYSMHSAHSFLMYFKILLFLTDYVYYVIYHLVSKWHGSPLLSKRITISFIHSSSSTKAYALIEILPINYTNTHVHTHTTIRQITQIRIFFFLLLLQGIFRDKGTATEKWSIYVRNHFRASRSCEPTMCVFEFIWKAEGFLFWLFSTRVQCAESVTMPLIHSISNIMDIIYMLMGIPQLPPVTQ